MRKIIVTLLILMGIFPCSTQEAIIEQERPTYLEEVVMLPLDYEKLILENLWKKGVSVDMSYLILAQARHESSIYTSDVFIEGNNFFGLKKPKKRYSTAIGINRGHATYESLDSCVADYVYYLQYWKIPLHEKSLKKYVHLLKRKKYFEDNEERYYRALRKHQKAINS